MVDTWLTDFSFALRRLRRHPAGILTAALTLALGLGAVVTFATLFRAVLLEPFAFPEADRLVKVMPEHRETGTLSTVSYPAYERWQRATSLDRLALVRSARPLLELDGEFRRLEAAQVADGYFGVMGVAPQLGRGLAAGDFAPGAPAVAVVSHRWWRSTLGADPAVVGRTLRLDGEPVTVVGVMAPGYRGPRASLFAWSDLWLPLVVDEAEALAEAQHGFGVVARLVPGASLDAADREVDTLSTALATERPEDFRGWGATVRSLRELVVGEVEGPFALVLGAVALVLLIACTNVGQLLLAQGPTRHHELAVRGALGASAPRLLRQLLVEASVLALLASAGAVFVASWGLDLLVTLAPVDVPRLENVRLDGQALALALGLGLASAVGASLLPGLRGIRHSLRGELRASGRVLARPSGGQRPVLIAAEVALALVLLLSAGLVIESLRQIRADDLGFETDDLTVVQLDLDAVDAETRQAHLADLEQHARGLPGVDAAGLLFQPPPLEGSPLVFRYWLADRPPPEGLRHTAGWLASGGYRAAMDIPLLAGRWFDDGERATDSTALVINQRLALQLWPASEAVGRKLYSGSPEAPTEHTVVGVVADVRHAGPGVEPELAVEMYAPWGSPRSEATLVLRTSSESSMAQVADSARSAVRELLPRATVLEVQSGEAMLEATVARRRFVTNLLTLFAGLALLLSGAGIYGVMSTFVRRRRREIGIRMALGAKTRELLGWVFGRALGAVAVGLAAGVAIFAGLRHLLTRMLYGVSPGEPWVVGGVLLVLFAVATLATWFPARRATRTDPLESLRCE